MKKLIVLLISLFAIQVFSQTGGSGWYWQNPLPHGNDVYNLEFRAPNNLIQVGEKGTIAESTNGGYTYILKNSPTESDIFGVAAVNNNIVCIVAASGLYRSLDNKISWTQISTGTNAVMRSIDAEKNTVIAAGDMGVIIKSTNSGGAFYTVYSNPISDFNDIHKINSNIWYAGGTGGVILKSTNGGTNWIQQVTGTSSNFNEIDFADELNGKAVGDFGTIVKTTNGGINWINVSPGTSVRINGISMKNALVAVAVGDSGKIFRTTNCGVNWNLIPSGTTANLTCVLLSRNSTHGEIEGVNGVELESENDGESWDGEREDIDFIVAFFIAFSGGLDNYINYGDSLMAVGKNGKISKSTDGGSNWNNLQSGTTSDLYSGFAVDNQTIWVVGGKFSPPTSTILKTTNCGVNWFTQISPVTDILKDVQFINSTTGIIVGNNGKILRTTNAGNTWVTVTSSLSYNINSVAFITQTTGIAVADGGFMRRTIDGGATWISVPLVTASNLYSVSFADANLGVAVGATGITVRTTNGGVSWALRPTPQFNDLKSVYMLDVNTGYACGPNNQNTGSILKTINGGLNWSRQNSGTNNILNGILFINQTTGIAVGDYGTILKTTTGGIPLTVQQISEKIPENFYLAQNYPNPFNPSTKIKFDIPVSPLSFGEGLGVRLSVYDILGHEITTLLNENLKLGSYEFSWDASNHPSGVYFYRLEINGYSETKSMVLMK